MDGKLHYLIGGHRVTVQYAGCAGHSGSSGCSGHSFLSDLLPSYRPFLVQPRTEEEAAELVVSLEEGFRLRSYGREVGQFDCGGCNHGVYVLEDGSYQFEVSDTGGTLCSQMQCSPDFTHCRVALTGGNHAQRLFGLNNAIMMAYAFCFATRGTLLVHASVIRKEGKGYLMTAPSGTGKSTHTRLWYDHIPGCDLMNDDNPIVRLTAEGEAVVYGSPWSGKTPCYRNVQAPIGAFVRIRQYPRNEIHQLPAVEAFTTLLPAVSSMKWDRRIYMNVCATISALVGKVKVYNLQCLPNAEAARLCYETVSLFTI